MGSFGVIEGQVFGQIGAGVGHIVIGPQIDFLVFDRLPQPLDKDVVAPCAFAVHADFDVVFLENIGESRAGKLAALVGVEDFRGAVFGNGLLQCPHAKVVRHLP